MLIRTLPSLLLSVLLSACSAGMGTPEATRPNTPSETKFPRANGDTVRCYAPRPNVVVTARKQSVQADIGKAVKLARGEISDSTVLERVRPSAAETDDFEARKFALCEAYGNGALTGTQYYELFQTMFGHTASDSGTSQRSRRDGPDYASLTVGVENRRVQVRDPSAIALTREDLGRLNASEYYIDTVLGFAFHKPTTRVPYKVFHLDGILEQFGFQAVKVSGIETGQVVDALRKMQGGEMIVQSKMLALRFGNPLHVYYIGEPEDSIADDSDSLIAYRDTLTLDLVNVFTVSVLDRALLPASDLPFSLERFFLIDAGPIATAQRGGRIEPSQLVSANDRIALYSFFASDSVVFDGRQQQVRVDRWTTYYDTPRFLFRLQILFCPQTKQPIELWESLQTIMDSFVLVPTDLS